MMPLNHIPRKCTARYSLSRSQEKINHQMYMDDIKLFAKNKKELETLIPAVRICSRDIGIEFSIEKCAIPLKLMLVMKNGKRHLIDGMELPNQDKIRAEKRKPTNTWSSWKLTPSNKWRGKTKLRKNITGEQESYSRQNYLAETLSKE